MNIADLHGQFCEYCLAMKNYRPMTIKGYQGVFKGFIRATEVREVEQVTPEIVRTFFFRGRMERQWSTQTFINYRKELIVFFAWCVKNKYLSANPFDGLEKPKLEKRLPKHLTLEQAQYLLEVTRNLPVANSFIRHRNYAVMATFMYCGLRMRELLSLGLADVDLENRLISVRQGKGAKDRMVPIPFDLLAILRNYLQERVRLKRTCPAFFASSNRNQGFTVDGLKHLVHALKKASRLEFHIHMLRHTFATLMLEGGCDIFSLSKIMGHSDIKTTTIYLGVNIDHLKTAIEKHPLQARLSS